MKKLIVLIILANQMIFLSDSSIFAQWLNEDPAVVWTNDKVGIGTSTPYAYTSLDIRNSLSYGYKTGGWGITTSTGNSFIGESQFRFGEVNTYYGSGYGVGIMGFASNVTKLRNCCSSNTSLALGCNVGVLITDPIPVGYESVGYYYISGMKTSLSGSITRYPTNGIVTALLSQDNIKGTNTWAGYFDGNVGVKGKIMATEVKVQNLPWSDFVFKKDYKLISITSLQEFIQKNGHLPDMPNEKEIQNNGLNLGEMNAKLLQKIEELTLYMIEMNKRMDSLETENSALKEKLEKVE